MSMQVTGGYQALTDKEKQTLRLIVRGHDAKSVARYLDLSVHTINERLRDARRKMGVSSSREAARLLFDTESEDPDFLGDVNIGEAKSPFETEKERAPISGAGRTLCSAWITMGVCFMTFALGLFALIALPLGSATSEDATDTTVVESARQWLALVDQGRWEDSYRATGAPFRRLNTSQVWASASEKVRTPLGAVISRVLLSEENLPAPPSGYEVVKFRTSFANRKDAVETVSLDQEQGSWRVVGVTIS